MEFQYGEILPEIPQGFVPPEMWPEYGHIGNPPGICAAEILNGDPTAIRWSMWPFTFEQHWGEHEPDLAAASKGKLARNRIVYWHPIHRVFKTAPKGWHLSRGSSFRVDGYQELADENFVTRWNKKARRDLRLWQERHEGKTHEIVEISDQEYDAAYRKSLVAKRVDLERLHGLNRRLVLPEYRKHVRLYAVRNLATGNIVGGCAVICSPTFKSATHFAPFILAEGREVYAATALVHHWFREALRTGHPHVLTINFWFKGRPKEWKGFSLFKSHFGWEYVTYPPTLWRFMRGKLW